MAAAAARAGRTAPVTGSTQGIGRAIATGLASAGIGVCVHEPDEAAAQDIVGAAMLLCSDAGSYINGAAIAVDGGLRL